MNSQVPVSGRVSYEGGVGRAGLWGRVEAAYARQPVIVDGRLDDAIWREASRYSLVAMMSESGRRNRLHYPGVVSFAWNAEFFYVGAHFVDRDIVAEGEADGLFHHRLGDVCEVFLKPAGQPWYCELHVSPKGHHTAFVWPSGGRGFKSGIVSNTGIKAAAEIYRTLDDSNAQDDGWTAEMAVPIAFLEESGERFGPDAEWTILIGRYNYALGLAEVELSSMPAISRVDFHLTKEYARLIVAPDRADKEDT